MVDGAVAGMIEEQNDPGVLPYQEPLRTWASRGTGVRCNLCGLPIEARDIEYEVELAPAANPRGLHFHFKCYRLWETGG
jgi:hypothetical protein